MLEGTLHPGVISVRGLMDVIQAFLLSYRQGEKASLPFWILVYTTDPPRLAFRAVAGYHEDRPIA